ncbi:MAG: hypothetical protein M0Q88_07975 [Bacilli bacterium]|nr:hypothetical protein [Bacilli bacterium]
MRRFLRGYSSVEALHDAGYTTEALRAEAIMFDAEVDRQQTMLLKEEEDRNDNFKGPKNSNR